MHHYFAIHGLGQAPEAVRSLVYDVAIDRLLGLADAGGFRLTMFAVGADLARPEAAAAVAKCHALGHEIANHSLDHRYDFVRLGRDEIRRQIEQGAQAIARACGSAPVGFRAPGYTITREVFDVLEELGVVYDASVFPCPSYFAAKSATIAAMTLRGRATPSLIDSPAVLAAPTRPYRVGRPYWRPGAGMREFPVQVTRGLRLPFIGTSLVLGGSRMARVLARMCTGEPFVNLELHGIDVLGLEDGLAPLERHQPDARVMSTRKIEALLAATGELKSAGYEFVTLRQAADAYAQQV